MTSHTMLKLFSILVVWLLLYPLITVAQEKKCSVVPVTSAAIIDDPHEITCFAQPGTMILSWKNGKEPERGTSNFSNPDIFSTSGSNILPLIDLNIFTLGIAGTDESEHLQIDGYEINYYSVRKSTMRINAVKEDRVRPFFCLVLDIVTRVKHYCESKLSVFVARPYFGSLGMDLVNGLVTNVVCNFTLKGAGKVYVTMTNRFGVTLKEIGLDMTNFTTHDYSMTYIKKVDFTLEAGYLRISPDHGVYSTFRCYIKFDRTDIFRHIMDLDVDAPVTTVSIVPHNVSRCSERRCYMHEGLTCTFDGRPKPVILEWKLSIDHGELRPMLSRTPHQYVLISGRNTFECRVVNTVYYYIFTAAGRFSTHVEAFEWVLDEHAMLKSKGSSHKVLFLMMVPAAVTGISWVFMTCGHYYCHV